MGGEGRTRRLILLSLIAISVRKKVIPIEVRGVTKQHSTALGRLKRKADVTRGFPKTNIPRFYIEFPDLTHNIVEE